MTEAIHFQSPSLAQARSSMDRERSLFYISLASMILGLGVFAWHRSWKQLPLLAVPCVTTVATYYSAKTEERRCLVAHLPLGRSLCPDSQYWDNLETYINHPISDGQLTPFVSSLRTMLELHHVKVDPTIKFGIRKNLDKWLEAANKIASKRLKRDLNIPPKVWEEFEEATLNCKQLSKLI